MKLTFDFVSDLVGHADPGRPSRYAPYLDQEQQAGRLGQTEQGAGA
jgi:hypothetical protein